MKRLSVSRTACFVFVFCAATAIASPAQILTTLYSFCTQHGCTDGSDPAVELVQASDGNFYGTTLNGGNSNGTVFKITASGTLTTLHRFDGTDGAAPYGAPVQATDGNFYGTTNRGGTYGGGTVFRITASGTLTTLHSFDGSDGAGSYGALVQASDGNLYGTTHLGGANGDGTVFRITLSGTFTTLHTFDGSDGASPDAGLIQASDGNLYGTTFYGGANRAGTVFEITPSGTLSTLYSFCSQPNCADGALPEAALVQASDGNFYGTTPAGGGASNFGTVFKITPSGTLTTLYDFCSLSNCADGAYPDARLIQATDGIVYGTTAYGGASGNCSGGCGTVFKITVSGTLTTLHSFSGPDGAVPLAGLIHATDGNFYGTTLYGGAGANGDGTVFRLVFARPCFSCSLSW